MAKTLTKKEMIAALVKAGTPLSEKLLRSWDRDNLEFYCHQYGIQVYTTETDRCPFERLIGYDFGTCILLDIARDGSRKQFILELPDGNMTVADYRTFKEYIHGCDYPRS